MPTSKEKATDRTVSSACPPQVAVERDARPSVEPGRFSVLSCAEGISRSLPCPSGPDLVLPACRRYNTCLSTGGAVIPTFHRSTSPFVRNVSNDNGPCLTAAAGKKYFDGIFQPLSRRSFRSLRCSISAKSFYILTSLFSIFPPQI